MTKNLLSAALAVIAGFAVGSAQAACEDNWKDCAGKPWVDGDSTDTPLGSIWWPHPIWGEGDQAGSTNWYKKPEVVMRALGAVKEGMTYRLGHEYHSGMPMFGQRKWVIRIPDSPTGGPVGQNKIIWHDEFLATEIGQAGTQFDGLGHVGVQVGEDGDKTNIRFYNGYTVQNMAGLDGLQSMAGLDGLQNTAGIDRLQDGEASLGALSGGDTDQPFSPTEAGYAATATSDGVLEGVRQGAIDVASKSFGTAAKLAATAITGVPVVGTIVGEVVETTTEHVLDDGGQLVGEKIGDFFYEQHVRNRELDEWEEHQRQLDELKEELNGVPEDDHNSMAPVPKPQDNEGIK